MKVNLIILGLTVKKKNLKQNNKSENNNLIYNKYCINDIYL